jgi:arylformamidase
VSGWIDISVLLKPGMAVWPGDPPLEAGIECALARGDEAEVSSARLSLHCGTHLDAPRHYFVHGATMDSFAVEQVCGRARVLDIPKTRRIERRHLEPHAPRRGERLLLKTRNSRLCEPYARFRADFTALAPDAARYLAGRGVRLAGIDYLSIGPFGEEGGEAHRILLGSGVWVLESLDLQQVGPGAWNLLCLPLRFAGAEGAPARAFLKRC